MARRARKVEEIIPDSLFEGTTYSNKELEFLLAHFGEPAYIALLESEDADDDDELPEGVNPDAVRDILDLTHRLDTLEKRQRELVKDETLRIWVGFDRLSDVCRDTLNWRGTVQELKRRSRGSSDVLRRAAGAPSLHMWDPDTDIPYLYGVGADAEFTRTALDEGGVRRPLTTNLRTSGEGAIKSLAGVASFIKSKSEAEQRNKVLDTTPSDFEYEVTGDNGIVSCPICGKADTYQVSLPQTKKMALMRMTGHLNSPGSVKPEQHHILLRRIQSGKGGSRDNRQRVKDLDDRREQKPSEE